MMVGQRSAAQIQHAVRSTVILEQDGQRLMLGDYAASLNNDGLAWALQESIKKLIAAHKYGTGATIGKEREMLGAILGATVTAGGALTHDDIPEAVRRIDESIADAIAPGFGQQRAGFSSGRG